MFKPGSHEFFISRNLPEDTNKFCRKTGKKYTQPLVWTSGCVFYRRYFIYLSIFQNINLNCPNQRRWKFLLIRILFSTGWELQNLNYNFLSHNIIFFYFYTKLRQYFRAVLSIFYRFKTTIALFRNIAGAKKSFIETILETRCN